MAQASVVSSVLVQVDWTPKMSTDREVCVVGVHYSGGSPQSKYRLIDIRRVWGGLSEVAERTSPAERSGGGKGYFRECRVGEEWPV